MSPLYVPTLQTVTSYEVGRVCHCTLRDFELAPNRRGARSLFRGRSLIKEHKAVIDPTCGQVAILFASRQKHENRSDPWSVDDFMSYQSGDRSDGRERGYRFCGRLPDPQREEREKGGATLSLVRPLSDLVSGVTSAGSGESRRVPYLTALKKIINASTCRRKSATLSHCNRTRPMHTFQNAIANGGAHVTADYASKRTVKSKVLGCAFSSLPNAAGEAAFIYSVPTL